MFPFTKEQIKEHLKDTTISEDEREFYEAMLNDGEVGILKVLKKHRQRDLAEIERIFAQQPK